jgi:excisionase family DNA binding protein
MRTYTGPIEPLLLSVTHVAKMIGFGRTKTYELIQSGKIPSILVEGRLRVTRQALDAWIAQATRSTLRSSARYS